MAGIDGVRRKLDPTKLGFGPVDEDIFKWSADRRAQVKALPTSLDEALDALDGEVFSEALIGRWAARRRQDSRDVQNRPHPYEIELYSDL